MLQEILPEKLYLAAAIIVGPQLRIAAQLLKPTDWGGCSILPIDELEPVYFSPLQLA